jgi:ankyrin repeat protein
VDDDAALEAVKLLVSLGADVKASNSDGDTCLHGAAFHGYANVIEFLASQGADLTAKNKAGQTPLDLTVETDNNIGQHEVRSAGVMLRKLLGSGKPE